ncbi:DUF5708 family protein [Georgenia faecalis]|uniref:DUF5708 family protein n=1 Tax=Georgenia faecalis TaxID=2483799 RepID=A0ABV9D984_9MICO|nr:DUF5708 family protein [Georgenia faecalis]
MSKHGWELLVGALMVVGGVVMFVVFRDVETPVIGLRQAGLVIAVLGGAELAATAWSMTRSKRPED